MISPQSLTLLPDVALIEKRSASQDEEGGIEETWSTRYAALPCQVSALGTPGLTTEVREADGEFVRADSRAFVTGDSGDICETDRVTVSGVLYDVVGVGRYSGLAVTELHLQRRVP